ncbi:hypothetical protein ACOSQ2_003586 [Xanthoceras sorbifolium]
MDCIPAITDFSIVHSSQLVCPLSNDFGQLVGAFPLGTSLQAPSSLVFWHPRCKTQSPSLNVWLRMFLLESSNPLLVCYYADAGFISSLIKRVKLMGEFLLVLFFCQLLIPC